jgi:hypothetical protein
VRQALGAARTAAQATSRGLQAIEGAGRSVGEKAARALFPRATSAAASAESAAVSGAQATETAAASTATETSGAGAAASGSAEAASAGGVQSTTANVGRAADPGLAEFVARLEGAGIKVTNTNINIVGEGGRILGEVDVVTEQALIQFKNGPSSARAVIDQVTTRTEPFVNRPVIAFINDTGRAGERTVRGAGRHILVTNDFSLLVDVIR